MLLVDEVRRRPREDRSGSGLMFGSRYKAGGKSWLPSPSLGHILWWWGWGRASQVAGVGMPGGGYRRLF